MARFKTCTSQYVRVFRNTQGLTAGPVSYLLKIPFNLTLFCATSGADAVLAVDRPDRFPGEDRDRCAPPGRSWRRAHRPATKWCNHQPPPAEHLFSRISEICHFFAPRWEALRF